MSLPQTYTTAEVAASLRKSIDWLYDQVKEGNVNPARDGESRNSAFMWTAADVEKLLASLRPAVLPKRRRRGS